MVEEHISEACNQKFTELDVSRVVSYFRALNSGNFHVSFSRYAKKENSFVLTHNFLLLLLASQRKSHARK